jgi:hypothetical protein
MYIERYESEILNLYNNEQAEKYYLKAKSSNDIGDINLYAEEVIATGVAKYIYLLAKDVSSLSIDKLADATIATGDVEYIFKFARDIEGAPIDTLMMAIYKIERDKVQKLENKEPENKKHLKRK